MVSLTLVITSLVCLWTYFLWRRRRYYAFAYKVPGPLGLPILGIAPALSKREDVFDVLDRFYQKYGSVYSTFLGPFPLLFISEPNLIQDVFTSHDCVNKGVIYKVVEEGTGRGLFSLSDPEWSRHRKLLNPAFSHKVLQSFIPLFNKEANNLLKLLEGKCNDGGQNLFKITQTFTLPLATQTTMGVDVRSQKGSNNEELLDCYERLLAAAFERMNAPWLGFPIIRSILSKQRAVEQSKDEVFNFVKKLVNNKIEAKQNGTDKSAHSNIFINIAIDLLQKGLFDSKQVQDESNVIVFGAFETTANTVGYIIMCLAMFPEVQEKLFEEIVNVFPQSDDFEVSIADTQQLVYLDMIVNESMRVFAPVPYVARKPSKDIKLSNGLIVPHGTEIVVDIFHLHRRKDIWGPDADKFNPDNFLPSNMENRHSYAFVPFTKGARNCIGWRYGVLATKVFVTKLVRHFHFTTDFKYEDLAFIEDITLKMKETPLINIHRREN